MHNHDDKYPARPGFEPGTSRLRAPVDTNEPSGPASRCETTGIHVFVSSSTSVQHQNNTGEMHRVCWVQIVVRPIYLP